MLSWVGKLLPWAIQMEFLQSPFDMILMPRQVAAEELFTWKPLTNQTTEILTHITTF